MRTKAMATAIVVMPVLLGAAPASVDGPLDALAFMTGCWRGAVNERTTIEESWTAADGDVMLATTRYLRGDRVVDWEFSRIHADSAGIHLTPYPDGQARPAFDLVPSPRGTAIFRNEGNDFPRDITYRRDEEALVIRLEGSGREMEWRLRAGACPR